MPGTKGCDPCTHCDGETFRPVTTTAVLAVRRAPNVMHQLSMAPRHRISEKPATTRRAALTAPAYGQMWRVYYYAGGQTIAMRTHELDPIFYEHYTMLYYLHTDHLGSTSVTTCGHANCGTVGAVLSRQSYYPYGGVRQQVGTLPTRRTYTGQYADDTGLMFYNARYYAPALGRFISADSIVPGAGNPQAFNRYMYVLGNPLKYTDPSGHVYICAEGCDDNNWSTGTIDWLAYLARYGVEMVGNWTARNILVAVVAVADTGQKLRASLGGTAADAFSRAFGTSSSNPMILFWGNAQTDDLTKMGRYISSECAGITAGGCTSSPRLINFMSLSEPIGERTVRQAHVSARNNIVHELGHAFANRFRANGPYQAMGAVRQQVSHGR